MTAAAGHVFEVAVIGGGLAGAGIAFGLADLGASLVVLDDGDAMPSASRGASGLVRVQPEGHTSPEASHWAKRAAGEWPSFAAAVEAASGIDVAFAQRGSVRVCTTAEALAARGEMLARLSAQQGFERDDFAVLDRAALRERLPGIGPDVAGGTWCALDGEVDPLRLAHALHVALRAAGVDVRPRHPVGAIDVADGRFVLATPQGTFEAARVVLAAGLRNAALAPMVGLDLPLAARKRHVLALERVAPFLPFPTDSIRQTRDGHVLVGGGHDLPGDDEATDLAVAGALARRAQRILPALAQVRVLRAWAALHARAADGLPVYARSASCPGAFLIGATDAVTLVPLHARVVAPAIGDGSWPSPLRAFDLARLADVRAAA